MTVRVRVAWDVLPDDWLRKAVSTAERFADGQASKDELASARAAIATMTYDDGPFGHSPSGGCGWPSIWRWRRRTLRHTRPRSR